MNKLRLIRIYELRGLIHPIEHYVIDLLDGIEEVSDGDIIRYWKDDMFYFSYNLNTNNIDLNLEFYMYKFECSYEKDDEVFKYLLEKHLKIEINIVY